MRGQIHNNSVGPLANARRLPELSLYVPRGLNRWTSWPLLVSTRHVLYTATWWMVMTRSRRLCRVGKVVSVVKSFSWERGVFDPDSGTICLWRFESGTRRRSSSTRCHISRLFCRARRVAPGWCFYLEERFVEVLAHFSLHFTAVEFPPGFKS